MFKFKKNFLMLCMVVLVSIGWSCNQLFILWFLMEINFMLFLVMMSLEGNISASGNMMKFFLIQSFSSLSLFIYMLLMNYFAFLSKSVSIMVVVMKMGLVPLHVWILPMINSWTWKVMYTFNTLQKMIPLMILDNLKPGNLILLSVVGWLISGISSLSVKKMKQMFMFSSLFFMGTILMVIPISSKWIMYFIFYSIFSFPVITLDKIFPKNISMDGPIPQLNWQFKILFWMFILNIYGFPPLPGFFLKLDFILLMLKYSVFLTFMFLMFSVTMLSMYMYMSMKIMLSFNLYSNSLGSGGLIIAFNFIISVIMILFLILCVGVTRKILIFKTL